MPVGATEGIGATGNPKWAQSGHVGHSGATKETGATANPKRRDHRTRSDREPEAARSAA